MVSKEVIEWGTEGPKECASCGYDENAVVEPEDTLAEMVIAHEHGALEEVKELIEAARKIVALSKAKRVFTGPRMGSWNGVPYLLYSCGRCGHVVYMRLKGSTAPSPEEAAAMVGQGSKKVGETRELDHRTH